MKLETHYEETAVGTIVTTVTTIEQKDVPTVVSTSSVFIPGVVPVRTKSSDKLTGDWKAAKGAIRVHEK